MMSANISVVIPVKKEEAKIMQCLEAVFSQSLKPYEVLVVDGIRLIGRWSWRWSFWPGRSMRSMLEYRKHAKNIGT